MRRREFMALVGCAVAWPMTPEVSPRASTGLGSLQTRMTLRGRTALTIGLLWRRTISSCQLGRFGLF
jgi:hypothetical protein